MGRHPGRQGILDMLWEQVEAERKAKAAGKGAQRYEGTWLARKPERQPPKMFWGDGNGEFA